MALLNATVGIKLNGLPINKIRFADVNFQILLTKIAGISEEYDLTLKIKESKFMIVAKKKHL